MSNPVRVRHDLLDRSRGTETLVFTTHENSEEGPDPDFAWDDMTSRAIGRVLHSHYRGHDWSVWVSRKLGIAKVWIPPFMNPQYPYKLDIRQGVLPADVMRAGGEILERYEIPRSNVDFSLVAQLIKKLGPLADRRPPPGGIIRAA